MGNIVDAYEVKTRSLVPLLTQLEVDDIEDLFVFPAEKLIAEACNLDLDTDFEPWNWAETFDERPDLREAYQDDYRRSVLLLVNRMAANPHGFASQGLRSSSVTFGSTFPPEIKAIMARWSQPRRLFRT